MPSSTEVKFYTHSGSTSTRQVQVKVQEEGQVQSELELEPEPDGNTMVSIKNDKSICTVELPSTCKSTDSRKSTVDNSNQFLPPGKPLEGTIGSGGGDGQAEEDRGGGGEGMQKSGVERREQRRRNSIAVWKQIGLKNQTKNASPSSVKNKKGEKYKGKPSLSLTQARGNLDKFLIRRGRPEVNSQGDPDRGNQPKPEEINGGDCQNLTTL